MNSPTDNELKAAFAALLLAEPNNPFGIALRMFPAEIHGMGKALEAAHSWPRDPYVIECQQTAEALKEESLPTKTELIELLWKRIQSAAFADDVAKLTKQYLDVRGWVEKPQNAAPAVIVDNRRVMIVKDHGTDEDWAAKAEQQQSELTSSAFATRH